MTRSLLSCPKCRRELGRVVRGKVRVTAGMLVRDDQGDVQLLCLCGHLETFPRRRIWLTLDQTLDKSPANP